MENVQYSTWAEFFIIDARSSQVINHIILSSKAKVPTTNEEKEEWYTIDATVLK